VIWKGLTIDEATWEPEHLMKCKDKIEEFNQHYDNVKKRKAEKLAAQGANVQTAPPKLPPK